MRGCESTGSSADGGRGAKGARATVTGRGGVGRCQDFAATSASRHPGALTGAPGFHVAAGRQSVSRMTARRPAGSVRAGRFPGPAESLRVLNPQYRRSCGRRRQQLGRRGVTDDDRAEPLHRGEMLYDEGAGRRSVQGRAVLGRAGHTVLCRVGRAMTTVRVFHRLAVQLRVVRGRVVDRVVVLGRRCVGGHLRAEMGGDTIGAHDVRVHEGQQQHGHPQHAQRTRRRAGPRHAGGRPGRDHAVTLAAGRSCSAPSGANITPTVG